MEFIYFFFVSVLVCVSVHESDGKIFNEKTLKEIKVSSKLHFGKIIGGEQAKFGEFPYQAAFLCPNANYKSPVCGGSIIDELHILTAGHCVAAFAEYPPCQVRVGFQEVGSGTGINGLDINIEKLFLHPKYNDSTADYDIGIVKLQTKIKFIPGFTCPVKLPVKDSDCVPGTNLTVSGYGLVNGSDPYSQPVYLRKTTLPCYKRRKCERLFYDPDFPLSLVNQRNICAGGQKGYIRDICSGDSGGPLVKRNGKACESVQVGIVSKGVCGVKGVPGIYTRVSKFIDWIAKICSKP